jgi:hypothetical protein
MHRAGAGAIVQLAASVAMVFALTAAATAQRTAGPPGTQPLGWSAAFANSVRGGLNDAVDAFAVFDDHTGPALYAGGEFTMAGPVPVNHVAKWNGTTWIALGSGLDGPIKPWVYALAVFDDGTGPALYAGGNFTVAGSTPVNHIAKWNGSTWAPLGNGTDGMVNALAVFNGALYAGGQFSMAGTAAASNVAKWNGQTWSALGGGVNNNVSALTVYDDGHGPALYAGGAFTTAGQVSASHIAKWNGTTWTPLATGTDDAVWALTVFNDGTGSALYAGGVFRNAGGGTADRVARWNGTAWAPVGPAGWDGTIGALTVYNHWCPHGLQRRRRLSPLRWRPLHVGWRESGQLRDQVGWRDLGGVEHRDQ